MHDDSKLFSKWKVSAKNVPENEQLCAHQSIENNNYMDKWRRREKTRWKDSCKRDMDEEDALDRTKEE